MPVLIRSNQNPLLSAAPREKNAGRQEVDHESTEFLISHSGPSLKGQQAYFSILKRKSKS